MSRDITVREGTSEKYWYTLAGYVAITVIAILFTVVSASNTTGGAAAFTGSITILGLSVAGLVVYPALFKDSAYLRGTNQYWLPKWWYYVGFGLGIPVLLTVVGGSMSLPLVGGSGIIIHALTAPAAASYYLYKRHKHIGVP